MISKSSEGNFHQALKSPREKMLPMTEETKQNLHFWSYDENQVELWSFIFSRGSCFSLTLHVLWIPSEGHKWSIYGISCWTRQTAWAEPGQNCEVSAICCPYLPPFLPLPFKSLSGTLSIAFRVLPDANSYFITEPQFSIICCVNLCYLK